MTVTLSGILLRFADFQKEISYDCSTVDAALAALVKDHPRLKGVLLDGKGNMRQVHRLFLNGEQLLSTDMQHELGADDKIEIITAIAGG